MDGRAERHKRRIFPGQLNAAIGQPVREHVQKLEIAGQPIK
jgi:hypothetical protein